MAWDISLLYFLNGFAGKSEFLDAVIIFLAAYLQYFLIALFFLFLYFSAYSKKEKLRIFLTAIASAILSRLAITEIIRFLYHRSRPFLEYPVTQILTHENTGSFPSGHSALFFALAFAVFFFDKKWGSVFFAAALLMNIARVAAGIHYPLDVLGGMVIGAIAASIVFYLTKNFLAQKTQKNFLFG